MLAVKGRYQDGIVRLLQDVQERAWSNVVVIFLDDAEPVAIHAPTRKRFSFRQAQDALKTYHGSLSDAVLEERKDDDLSPMRQTALDCVYDDFSAIIDERCDDAPLNTITKRSCYESITNEFSSNYRRCQTICYSPFSETLHMGENSMGNVME